MKRILYLVTAACMLILSGSCQENLTTDKVDYELNGTWYGSDLNKEHNHISPEGTVDLGTAIFPDSTFCFRHQVHDDTAYNDVALLLCKEILTNKNFKDVYSDPRFPQFNGSRDIFRIKYRLLPEVDELLKKDLPEDVKNAILKSVEEVNSLFNNTIIKDRTEADEITKRFDEAIRAGKEV